jgi:hypothetical protein
VDGEKLKLFYKLQIYIKIAQHIPIASRLVHHGVNNKELNILGNNLGGRRF